MYEWVEKVKDTIGDLVLTPEGEIIQEEKEDFDKLYDQYLTEQWTLLSL